MFVSADWSSIVPYAQSSCFSVNGYVYAFHRHSLLGRTPVIIDCVGQNFYEKSNQTRVVLYKTPFDLPGFGTETPLLLLDSAYRSDVNVGPFQGVLKRV